MKRKAARRTVVLRAAGFIWHLVHEQAEQRFKLYSVQNGRAQFQGGGGAGLYEGDRPLRALGERSAFEQASQQHTGKQIAGAGEMGGLLPGLGEGDAAGLPVPAAGPYLTVGETYSRDDQTEAPPAPRDSRSSQAAIPASPEGTAS